MSKENLHRMFRQADSDDYREGMVAYNRYHVLMCDIARMYGAPLDRTVAAFCALSPNNDYTGNLRSLVTCLDAWSSGRSFDTVQVSTYRHCGERAWSYLDGSAIFLEEVKGLKIRNFYTNVLHPDDPLAVTIDGHMVAAYRGQNLTMKEAICRTPKEYNEIAFATRMLSFMECLSPSQYQAIVWFTRKRVFNIKYEGNRDLFLPANDLWRTSRDASSIMPFRPRVAPVTRPPETHPALPL